MISFDDYKRISLLENEEDIETFINQPKLKYIPQAPQAPRVTTDKDNQNKLNKIVKPKGIIFQDTWNNFVFPIQPRPRIDTSKFETSEVFKRYRELYLKFPSIFLPWHYVIEMIGNRYYIFQTRPIDTRYPITIDEILANKYDFKDEETRKFFDNKLYPIEDMIHICLIGDTNLDVYPEKLYRQIGRTCVAPFFRDMRITGSVETRTFGFNLGEKFKLDRIIKFAKK